MRDYLTTALLVVSTGIYTYYFIIKPIKNGGQEGNDTENS